MILTYQYSSCSDMERLKEIDEELIKFNIQNLNNLV